HLHPGDHVGLVGRNGSGKTTLLRAMVGELGADGGRIVVRSGARVGWLPQQAVSGSTRTVWEEARSGMTRLLALKAELDAAEARAGDPGGPERLERATDAFRLAGGYAADEKVGEVLHGLGFLPETWHRTCDTFSGGWQMRIALARLLLSDPDVALFDEPTNHLDLEARTWLANHLAAAPYAFVVVSHDRWLLDRCVSRVAEVRNRKVHEYTGNFASFLAQRELRDEQAATAYGRQQSEIARLERFVERFGAKATKAAQARSRQKALDKMERVDAPEKQRKAARLKLPEAPPGALQAVQLVNATVGWSEDAPVLSGVDLSLDRGMRLVLLGPNGCGKSTILRALAGDSVLLAGRRRLGDRVRIGVFHQDLAQELPPDPSPLDLLAQENPLVPPERVRSVLGALGLPGDMALRPIGVLSGGEKARVALASLVLRPCNVLMLDEPTNHLDAETVDVLVEALQDYEGAVLLVTHDRFVVERVATHVGRIADGKLTLREGVRPEDFERPKAEKVGVTEVSAEAVDHQERKRRQREAERARRRLQQVQDEIPKAEAKLAELDDALIAAATDHAKVTELARQREQVQSAVDGLYAEWEALEEAVG
ncbi:MAG: ABC-F family ATP-binding cassette domain-containing protein, partial [Myxococcales bacterium]|nr:ABC-F family ATP-binding cassette domain-containing protein [Myxococcales bacterium]